MAGPLKAIGAVAEAYQLAKKQGWVARLRTALKRKHHILMLGSTGSGKTNLIDSLHQQLPAAISALRRTRFVKQHRLQISDHVFEFIDTPGQLGHRGRRTRAVTAAMRRDVIGVVNTACYGFHEYELDGTERDDALRRDRNADGRWLRTHRKIEIEEARSWLQWLGSQHVSRWLVTVCTKADLWWHMRDKVLAHYRSKEFAARLGVPRHVVVPYCSVVKRFYDAGYVSKEFDDAIREELRQNLLGVLVEAIAKEARDVP